MKILLPIGAVIMALSPCRSMREEAGLQGAGNSSGNQRRRQGLQVTVVADRGFGNGPVIQCLEALGFEYVLHIRGDFYVTNAKGERRLASD